MALCSLDSPRGHIPNSDKGFILSASVLARAFSTCRAGACNFNYYKQIPIVTFGAMLGACVSCGFKNISPVCAFSVTSSTSYLHIGPIGTGLSILLVYQPIMWHSCYDKPG